MPGSFVKALSDSESMEVLVEVQSFSGSKTSRAPMKNKNEPGSLRELRRGLALKCNNWGNCRLRLVMQSGNWNNYWGEYAYLGMCNCACVQES